MTLLLTIESQRISEFAERSEYLLSHSLIVNKTLRSGLIVQSDGEGFRKQFFEPPLEGLESLLLRLRPFQLKKERIHVPTLIQLLKRDFRESCDQTPLDTIKDFFLSRKQCSGIHIELKNGVRITPEDLFDNYLNGRFFHSDPNKKSLIADLEQDIGDVLTQKEVVRSTFFAAVINKVNAVWFLQAFLIEKKLI